MGRLAIDIGGTFTDLVYFGEDTGVLTVAKALSTPDDLTRGVMDTLAIAHIDPGEVRFFVHGGTTVINAITERKGAKTALVTTKGFRDILEIARGNRPDLYNLCFEKEAPFVPRALCFEARERVDARGNEIEPLHLEDLEQVVARCTAEGVEAIAVQFLHSYAAPEHEAACAEYLRAQLPGVAVTASHEITREWREYERANTAVLNAYVQPIVEHYLTKLEVALAEFPLNCPYFAMQSNGGTTTFDKAKQHPISLLESGPASGVNGAALVGQLSGQDNVIYLDIGGTTAKCATIENGQPKLTTEYRLERTRTRFGYPVRIPVVDIVEIGAGGGSITWFDSGGSLRVGPVSAGASPGPACYALGGEKPTVTDAKLITGVLNPRYFAGGRLRLKLDQAQRAMQGIAGRLGTGTERAAEAVIQLVDANMINALKLVSIQRGHDPRHFVLVATGGGGPMHAGALGRELGVKEIIVPLYPGLFSAWGMLATEHRRDFVRTALQRVEETTIDAVALVFRELDQEAKEYFGTADDLASSDLGFEHSIDFRYFGQEHSVTVPVELAGSSMLSILEDFHRGHERAYTFSLEDTPVELVSFRLAARSRVNWPEFPRWTAEGRSAEAAARGTRVVDLGEAGRHDAGVLNRDHLPPEFTAEGPLIVEEVSSTTVVYPGQRLAVDDLGFLRITEC